MTAPDFPALVATARDRMDQAERLAKDATPSPWELQMHSPDMGGRHGYSIRGPRHLGPQGHVVDARMTSGNASHVAFWDPGMALGVIRWGRDVLDRHTPSGGETVRGVWCGVCGCIYDQCPEVIAVLRAWVPNLLDEETR